MNLHVNDLLAAYHDGELSPNRRRQVESHIQECPSCRAELEALEGLSSFLKADSVPEHTSPQRFAAQVQLRIPRAVQLPARQKIGQPPRWVLGAPLALVIVWAFLQAAIWVSYVFLTADHVLGARVALFSRWLPTQSLFATGADLLIINVILLIGTAIFWSAWMAFWLAWGKNQNLVPTMNSL